MGDGFGRRCFRRIPVLALDREAVVLQQRIDFLPQNAITAAR
jgi:hypothetical protein